MSVSTMISVPASPRHALGLPAGSVRALHTLMVVGLVCALLLVPPRTATPAEAGEPTVTPLIPAYLLYLLFLALGHFFAAHGNSYAVGEQPPPLYVPAALIRVVIFLLLAGTLAYRLYTDPDILATQFRESVMSISAHPLLPVVILGGFFAGVLFRWVTGRQKAYWVQDIQAWFSLLAALGLVAASLIHLVIEPSLHSRLELPSWEGFLGVVVAFYFGDRS